MVEIIENTPETIAKFHERGCGGEEETLTKEHIEALLDGKAIAFDDGEYTHVLYLKKDDLK